MNQEMVEKLEQIRDMKAEVAPLLDQIRDLEKEVKAYVLKTGDLVAADGVATEIRLGYTTENIDRKKLLFMAENDKRLAGLITKRTVKPTVAIIYDRKV